MGPILRCGADRAASPHLVVVSDRRLIKVTNEWEKGEPLTGGKMTRRYLWLGQIRRIEVAAHAYRTTPLSLHALRAKTLILHTADGGERDARGGRGAHPTPQVGAS